MSIHKKNIVVGLSGGLGNQIFQYAAGRALALRLDLPLVLDAAWFRGRADRGYALAPLRISARVESGLAGLPDWLVALWCRAVRRWGGQRMGAAIFREPHFHFTAAFDDITAPVYLEGYWQSQRYFSSIRSTLIADLKLSDALPAAAQDVLQKICQSDAVCVHVRRGDYVSNPVAAATHGLCSLDYYQRALAVLPKSAQTHCFVFSDDPEWVKKNLQLDCPMTVVDVNDAQNPHRDLCLMAACRHFIIANSSLSWWAAWLGESTDKKVVAPLRWFNTDKQDTVDLIPNEWVRL